MTCTDFLQTIDAFVQQRKKHFPLKINEKKTEWNVWRMIITKRNDAIIRWTNSHALKLSIQNGSFRMVNLFPFVCCFNEQLLCALQSNFSTTSIPMYICIHKCIVCNMCRHTFCSRNCSIITRNEFELKLFLSVQECVQCWTNTYIQQICVCLSCLVSAQTYIETKTAQCYSYEWKGERERERATIVKFQFQPYERISVVLIITSTTNNFFRHRYEDQMLNELKHVFFPR